jgi:hypothetical protein
MDDKEADKGERRSRSRSRSRERHRSSSHHHRSSSHREREREHKEHREHRRERRRSRSRSPKRPKSGDDEARVRAAREFLAKQQQQQQRAAGPPPPPKSSSGSGSKKPRPSHAPELDPEEDYFRRASEFAAWLPGARGGQRFDGLPSADARRLFGEFCDDWNAGRVPEWLYDERAVEEKAREARTAHKWKLKPSAVAGGAGGAGGAGMAAGRTRPPPPPPPSRAAAAAPRDDERLRRARAEEEAKMAGLRAMLAGGPIQIAKREPPLPPPQ